MFRVVAASISAIMLAGCAQTSRDVVPSYVSIAQYGGYSCPQLAHEAQRIANRIGHLSGIQDENARHDQVRTAVAAAGAATAVIGVYTAAGTIADILTYGGTAVTGASLLSLKGNDAHTTELARLKAEREMVDRVFVRNNCQFRQQELHAYK